MKKEILYQSSQILRKVANRLYSKSLGVPSSTLPNIGADILPRHAKRALIIYNIFAVKHWYDQKLYKFDLNKHTMYWESIKMVKLLNKNGYIVDYVDGRAKPQVDSTRYDLIIDNWDNLKDFPKRQDQTKIYYATNMHWLSYNLSEINRIKMFYERTGIYTPLIRQLPTILSDEYADYITYFGTDTQKNSFNKNTEKVQLNISSVFSPEFRKKDIQKARNKFLWLGGGGLVLKGLDLVIEAFSKMPNAELFIAGNLQDKNEWRFWRWARPILESHPNMHMLGWVDVASPEFNEIADNCIGTVYASAAEGGPGCVAQTIQNGLIPIVTPTSLVRAETLGYSIDGDTAEEMINSIINRVQEVMSLPDKTLEEKSDAVRAFAQENHTRKAYSESFQKLINLIK